MRLVPIAACTHKETSWLWQLRIPKGEITVFEGDPGYGKTGIMCDLAARVTIGRAMPGGNEPTDPAAVIIISAEDAPHVLQGRLEAAGANLSRVYTPPVIDVGGGRPLTLPQGIGELEQHVREKGVQLIVLDPISSCLSGSSTSESSVRKALEPLAAMAQRNNVSVVIVRHLTKNGSGRALTRGLGSIALSGVPRSVLLLCRHPVDKDRRVIAQVKSNYGPLAESLELQLPTHDGPSRIVWGETTTLTPDQLLTNSDTPTQREEAAWVLSSLLADGPLSAKEVIKLAMDQGVSKRTLTRAKELLGVQSKKIGFGEGSQFVWQLPDQAAIVERLPETGQHALLDRIMDDDSETFDPLSDEAWANITVSGEIFDDDTDDDKDDDADEDDDEDKDDEDDEDPDHPPMFPITPMNDSRGP